MANSDPQSKRKRTWGEWFGGTKEGNAIASAKYKREMGINPSAKRISNAEASRSARSMDNPTSTPAPKLNAERRIAMDEMAKRRKPEAKPLRGTAGTYTKSYDVPEKTETPKEAPQKVIGQGPKKSKAPPKTVTKPARKMSAYERQRMQSLEKEGWGGRSMTKEKAKARVETEKGYKSPLKGLKFGSGKSTPKVEKAPQKASGKPLSGSFASKMQGRNVKGSPTYSPSGTKKKDGFKFKDLFKK